MAPGFDALTLLQRVLLLERQQGFRDRAAVGGLAEFARQQLERADAVVRERLGPAVSVLAGYGDADRRSREEAVSAALQAMLTGAAALPASATTGTAEPHPAIQDAQMVELPKPAGARRASDAPKLTIVHSPEDIERPVATIKGMRKPTLESLARVGVSTVEELLRYFPRTHYDYTDTRSISRMRYGEKTTLVGTIVDVRVNQTRRGSSITTATVADESGRVAVRWFNQPYLRQRLPLGARIAISGAADFYNGAAIFQPRDFELIDEADPTHTSRLVPIYPLTRGLFQRSLRQLIRRTVDEYAPVVPEHLPEELLDDLRLPSLPDAIRAFHFPDDEDERGLAQQRLAFDELLLVQLGLLLRKRDWQQPQAGVALTVDEDLHRQFEASLPFALTRAQQVVAGEVLFDLARPVPMSRLIEGDVGSGKTVVAAAALLQTARAGKQAVLMAPTEILAEQHFRTVTSLLAPFGVSCELLIGSTPKAQRTRVYEAAKAGSVSVLMGTHALIQGGLELQELRLAITDEQHRFGVEQRATLREKGLHPHVLAMTATPIPRTLAMTIYGDLDVSIIDEMPPGRVPPITTWARTPGEAYGVVRDEVRKGRQAFIICPVIEESAESDMRSVMAEHRELSSLTFSDLSVGLLHGKMKSKDKEATLEAFRAGEYQVLVATSVVEVGIDIPNATVMVIRDAHRFGLAQLHQFRGRVGRGGDQAYCVLLSAAEGEDAKERLEAVTATENGFELAEEDLRLRGPGEFWGTRQSGLPALKVAQLGDLPTIQLARRAALALIESDPELTLPEHVPLRLQVERFWSERADLS